MNEDTSLAAVLRQAMPPVGDAAPARDLWPAVARRGRPPAAVLWFDAVLAAVAAFALLARPDWLMFLAFHL
jgi:hypothetical protein